MQLKSALQQFGLNEKQAQVYLATLELGSAPVARISAKSKIPRATCYDILESLRSRGIASSFVKSKVRYYSVEDPRKILSLARQKVKSLEDIIPDLDALWGLAKERPRVRFFEGAEGIKQVYEEILQDKKDLLVFSSADDLLQAFGEEHLKFVERRIAAKIVVKTILRDTSAGQERKKFGLKELRQVKFIPPKFEYHGSIMLFGDKIAYISFIQDYVTVIIESKELVAIQRAALQFIWEKAE